MGMSFVNVPSAKQGSGAGARCDPLPVASCCEGQDWCTVLCTAERLSRKWHAVIIHRLLKDGSLGFAALQSRISGISGKVLTESLEAMEQHELIRRVVRSETPLRVEYRLTQPGKDFAPVVQALQAWGRRHLSGQ